MQADFCRLIRRARDLRGSARHLRGRIFDVAYEISQSFSHFGECVAQSVVLRSRPDLHTQIAAGNGFGQRRHFFEVGNHGVKGSPQVPNLVVSLNIDLVVEVPGLADLFRHLHKIGQRTRNRSRSLVCDENSQRQRDQSAQ